MSAAGIDYGVRRVAISLPLLDVFEEVNLGGSDDRVADIEVLADFCCDILTATRPEWVAVESPIVGGSRNLRTGLAMGMVAGALATTARRAGSQVVLIEPASWKKAVVGRGNADKEAVTNWLEVAHPEYARRCKSSQDLVDATCLALFAQTLLA